MILCTTGLPAHALHVATGEGNAVTIEARYGDGEAMQYGEVKIFAPGNDSLEYQKGRTDAEGRFAFLPSKKGDWTIRLSDGMGHMATKTVKVTSGLRASGTTTAGFNITQKIVMVLIVLWGAAGTALYFRGRSRR